MIGARACHLLLMRAYRIQARLWPGLLDLPLRWTECQGYHRRWKGRPALAIRAPR